jgi:hypothetical protein
MTQYQQDPMAMDSGFYTTDPRDNRLGREVHLRTTPYDGQGQTARNPGQADPRYPATQISGYPPDTQSGRGIPSQNQQYPTNFPPVGGPQYDPMGMGVLPGAGRANQSAALPYSPYDMQASQNPTDPRYGRSTYMT